MDIQGVEIFAAGKWNGTTITGQHLAEIARNHQTLADSNRVPLKLGHNDEQEITDGQPALGWVVNLRVENKKLLADFEQVPELVFDAIKAGRYDRVSVEIAFGVDVKGKMLGTVLTAVALLGADLPAVSDLEGLRELVASVGATSKHQPVNQVFTMEINSFQGEKLIDVQPNAVNWDAAINHQNEVKHMTTEMDKLQGQMSEMEKKLAITDKSVEGYKQRAEAAESKLEEVEKAKFKQAEETKVLLFITTRDSFLEKIEGLVKDGKLQPAIRQEIEKEAKTQEKNFAANDNSLVFTADLMLKVAEGEKLAEGETAGADGGSKAPADVNTEFEKAVKTYMAENKVEDIGQAQIAVLRDDKDLADRYSAWKNELN